MLSLGCHLMASLNICQSCASAKVLQASQGVYHQKSTQRAKTVVLTASTWNVHSMVDTEGPIEIASQQHSNQRGEDRKIDQIVLELINYGVSVGALQETKWFGDNVHEVHGSVAVTAGRPTPTDGEPIQCGEGVALMLMGSALAAWRCGRNNRRHGAQVVCQHIWHLLAVLGGYMCCLVMCLLELLNMRIKRIFSTSLLPLCPRYQ